MSSEISRVSGTRERDVRNDISNTDSTGTAPLNTLEQQFQYINNVNKQTESELELSYLEPLGKTTFLELNYERRGANTISTRITKDIDPGSGNSVINVLQSVSYNYQFINNQFGLNYRMVLPKVNFTLGVNAQPVTLKGQSLATNISTKKSFFNLVPTARFNYNISPRNRLRIDYRANSSQPGFVQLQPIRDVSDPQNAVIGNPDLNPELQHTVSLRYNRYNSKIGNSFFTNLSLNNTSNKIVSNRSNLPGSTTQEIRFTNTAGFFSGSGFYSFSKPLANKKYTLELTGGANFSNNISFINSERNAGRNWRLNQGIRFRIDIEEAIDCEISSNYSINNTNYSLSRDADTDAKTFQLGINGKTYFFKDWTIGYDLSKIINTGFSYTIKSNPFIMHTYLEHRFLKGNIGAIRVQGFDLFNQNIGIIRNVTGNQITDANNNRLARYFLVAFNLRMQKFTGKAPEDD